MFGWLGILAGTGSWIKENHDRNHPKYTPGTEDHWKKVEVGRKRFLADLDTVSPEERARRKALGYYDGENVDITDTARDANDEFFEALKKIQMEKTKNK